jgi:hypothetical protein
MSAQERQAFLTGIVPMLGSGFAAERFAKKLGMTSLMGKRLDTPTVRVKAPRSPRAGVDNYVSGDYYGWSSSQNEPSIAASPLDQNLVVAASHNDFNFSGVPNACSIYLSFDGGENYSYIADTPLSTTATVADQLCSDPVVRFSPDGRVFSISYMDIDTLNDIDNIRLDVWDGWFLSNLGSSTPLPSFPGEFLDKNWHDVHTFDAADGTADGGQIVYATSTLFSGTLCGILLNRSSDYGFTWDLGGGIGVLIDFVDPCATGVVPLLQGARPIGGPGQQVLVCYFDSGPDGWSAGNLTTTIPSNKFGIACKSSGDRGTTISSLFYASINIPYELFFWLGPNANYHRWWGGMFPSVAIDHLGVAHVAFAADPNANKVDPESGNVYTTRNLQGAASPPYATLWTARAAIGTGSMAQGWATVVAQRVVNSNKPIIYIAYADHYKSAALGAGKQNLIYDVRYRKSIIGGGTFQAPVTVTDQSSLSDFLFIGDYFDSSTTSRRYHVIWTDRADKFSIGDFEDDIFADFF